MMKCSFISYGYTLQSDVHIPNHQRAGQNAHTTLTQFNMPNYWLAACQANCIKVDGATSSEVF